MFKLIAHLWQKRIVKFATIGAIGLPLNLAALALFLHIFHLVGLRNDLLEGVATVCSFEVATLINFVLNQLVTYPEQVPGTKRAWVLKACKAQIANGSAFLIVTMLSIFLSVVIQVNPFVSNTLGIACTFAYKFLLSDRFVFALKPTSTQMIGKTIHSCTPARKHTSQFRSNVASIERDTDPVTVHGPLR